MLIITPRVLSGCLLGVTLLMWNAAGQTRVGSLPKIDTLPRLEAGREVRGIARDSDPVVETDTLRTYPEGPAVGTAYLVQVDKTGPYTVELRSFLVDTYLVLKDPAGQVLAEDDDGLYGTHSRIATTLTKDHRYRLFACALHGMRGEFSLRLVKGDTPELSAEEQLAREFADAKERVRLLGERGGSEDELIDALLSYGSVALRLGKPTEARAIYERALHVCDRTADTEPIDTAFCLNQLAGVLRSEGDLAEAKPLLERALSLHETIHGPAHTETATALNNLGAVLFELGKYEAAQPLVERSLAIREHEVGPEDPVTAATLDLLAFILKRRGKAVEAEPLLSRALRIREKLFDPDDPRTATSLNHLADVLSDLERYAEARSLFERALAIREKALPRDHPDLATSLDNLSSVLRTQDEYEKAKQLCERGLEIREKVFGAQHPHTAVSRENLGLILYKQGRYEEAKPHFESALVVYEAAFGPEGIQTASTLNNLAALLSQQGRYGDARPHYERALAIREKVLGAEHPDTATSFDNMGELLRALGKYGEARPLLERALAIRIAVDGQQSLSAAVSLNNLAYLLGSEGKYAEARSLFERAILIFEKLDPGQSDTATCLANLADILRRQGKYEEARPLFERALSIRKEVLGPEHSHTAASINNLALLLKAEGKTREAQRLFEQALAIYEKTRRRGHPYTASTLINLAKILGHQGEYKKAQLLYERALAIDEKEPGPEHPDTAACLDNMATLLRDQGNYREARPLFERVCAIREKYLGPQHPDTISIRAGLALLAHDTGQDQEAWELAWRAFVGSRARRLAVVSTASETDALLYSARSYDVIQLLLSLAIHANSHERKATAYQALLHWKGHVLRSQSRSKAQLLRALTVEQRTTVERLRSAQAGLSNLLSQRNIDDRTEYEKNLKRLRQEKVHYEEDLLKSLKPVGAEVTQKQLAAALPDDTVLLDFYSHRIYKRAEWNQSTLIRHGSWEPPRLSVWVHRPTADRAIHVDLGPTLPIESAVQAFLEDMRRRRGPGAPVERGASVSELSLRLYKILWEPLAEFTSGKALVLVSPDDFLGTLPFETLETPQKTYLVEAHGFVYLEDPTSIVKGKSVRKAPANSSLLAVGAVDYFERAAVPDGYARAVDLRGSGLRGLPKYWPPLSLTRRETDGIHQLHKRAFPEGKRTLIQDARATEENLKLNMFRQTFIHLATHGYFQRGLSLLEMWQKNPQALSHEQELVVGYLPGLLTGLVCAGANQPAPGRDNALLTAEEVAWTSLDDCELVVLSACETGLGTRRAGEGMMSLRRAFQEAGARTVISSLWRVPDDSTTELMLSFYRRLWESGHGKLEALRGAQREMLERNRQRFGGAGLPSSWGAFVLSGDWR